jgi:RNA polymerase sigma factor for flagellar operon FliA
MADRTPKSVELDDLIGEGTLGLLDAAGRFDPTRGIKFRTFAEQRIRGAMLDYLRSLDWVPRTLRQKQKEIEEAYHAISARHGRAAEDEEVAGHLGVPLEELHKSLDELKGINLGSFEDASGDGEGILAFIPDPDAEDPLVTLHETEFRRLLAEAIESLPDKERLAVQMYYYSELNMKEIGAALGITESRVSQLHTKAMVRLRGKMKSL